MMGEKQFTKLITPEEAIKLFGYSTDELYIANSYYSIFEEREMNDSDMRWNFLSLLSFIYMTGRIQGIREERAKRK